MRKQQTNAEFNQTIYDNIDSMFAHVRDAMTGMIHQLGDVENVPENEIISSYNKEREINNLRNQLRAANVENVNNRVYEYQTGIFYMDIIADLEKTGRLHYQCGRYGSRPVPTLSRQALIIG